MCCRFNSRALLCEPICVSPKRNIRQLIVIRLTDGQLAKMQYDVALLTLAAKASSDFLSSAGEFLLSGLACHY